MDQINWQSVNPRRSAPTTNTDMDFDVGTEIGSFLLVEEAALH